MDKLGKTKVLAIYKLCNQIIGTFPLERTQVEELLAYKTDLDDAQMSFSILLTPKMRQRSKGAIDYVCSKFIHEVDMFGHYMGLTAEDLLQTRTQVTAQQN